MAKPPKKKVIRKSRDAFYKISRIEDLSPLIGVPANDIVLALIKPRYEVFSIPKKDGSERWIENPNRTLKKIQRGIHFHLQCCYYFLKPECVFGFLIHSRNEVSPRNVLTNALCHLGKDWLLNLDMEDFFHTIRYEQVYQVFKNPPFNFKHDLSESLTRLTTYKGRLPMGAPSSPILSNWASLALDSQLISFALEHDIVYSRYADDMSFSSPTEITNDLKAEINGIVINNGYQLNAEKEKWYRPGQDKVVTGLVLRNGVYLPDDYIGKVETKIGQYAKILHVRNHYTRKSAKWLKNFREQITGGIEFASFVMGEEDPLVLGLEKQLDDAEKPPIESEVLSWLDFPYMTF